MMQKKLEKLFLILKKIHLIEDRDLNKVMEEWKQCPKLKQLEKFNFGLICKLDRIINSNVVFVLDNTASMY